MTETKISIQEKILDIIAPEISKIHNPGRVEPKSIKETVDYILDFKPFPTIVCLCGSTRFHKEFVKQNYLETMAGKIVLSVGFFSHADKEIHGEDIGITPEQKIMLDELHKRKIDMADEVFVLNVLGYIGESTKSEIEYAKSIGKPVRYLELFKGVV